MTFSPKRIHLNKTNSGQNHQSQFKIYHIKYYLTKGYKLIKGQARY